MITIKKHMSILKSSYIYFIIGLISIIYYSYINIAFGGLAFDEFFLCLGICFILYGVIKNKIKKNYLENIIIKLTIITIVAIFIIGEALMILYPKSDITNQCDYLIILGAAVKKNGPSLTLRARLNSAIEYLDKTKDDCFIVVSGGKGSDEKTSEAQAMKEYLVDKNINPSKIILEDKSTNTFENFKYSREKIEKHSSSSIKNLKIKVVTTDFHSLRSSVLAKRNEYTNVTFYSSKSKLAFIPVYYTREFFALLKTILIY